MQLKSKSFERRREMLAFCRRASSALIAQKRGDDSRTCSYSWSEHKLIWILRGKIDVFQWQSNPSDSVSKYSLYLLSMQLDEGVSRFLFWSAEKYSNDEVKLRRHCEPSFRQARRLRHAAPHPTQLTPDPLITGVDKWVNRSGPP